MDRNRIEGGKHDAKGNVKDTFGKPAGNPLQRPDGQHEKQATKAEKEVGRQEDRTRREQPHH